MIDAYGISFEGAWVSAWNLINQDGDRLVPMQPRRGFKSGQKILDHGLRETGSIHYGGSHGALVNMEVLGPRAQTFADLIRGNIPHTCSRFDSCIDFDGQGVWQVLVERCEDIKHRYKALHGERRGDWDKPDKGLTFTLGSPAGVHVRLYQKGKAPDYLYLNRPDWVRLELQVRPKGPTAKSAFATYSALQAWGAANWTKALLLAVTGDSVARIRATPPWKQTDDDHAFYWMLKQNRRRLKAAAAAWGGWAQLGVVLGRTLREIEDHG